MPYVAGRDGCSVRSAPASLVGLLLLVMLAATTPTGTGDRAHQNQLLHPLFAHVHLINGQMVTHATGAAEPVRPPAAGVALGAGMPLEAGGDGLVIIPALSVADMTLPIGAAARGLEADIAQPTERDDAPPDPPPTPPR
jgi:hypothetical protein